MIITWSRRLLLLTLFLFLVLVTNLYVFPMTFAYVGAVGSLIVTALFLLRDFEEDESREHVHKCTLTDTSVH